jgi:hypothetical protein
MPFDPSSSGEIQPVVDCRCDFVWIQDSARAFDMLLYEDVWLRELDGNVFNPGLLAARSREQPGGIVLLQLCVRILVASRLAALPSHPSDFHMAKLGTLNSMAKLSVAFPHALK